VSSPPVSLPTVPPPTSASTDEVDTIATSFTSIARNDDVTQKVHVSMHLVERLATQAGTSIESLMAAQQATTQARAHDMLLTDSDAYQDQQIALMVMQLNHLRTECSQIKRSMRSEKLLRASELTGEIAKELASIRSLRQELHDHELALTELATERFVLTQEAFLHDPSLLKRGLKQVPVTSAHHSQQYLSASHCGLASGGSLVGRGSMASRSSATPAPQDLSGFLIDRMPAMILTASRSSTPNSAALVSGADVVAHVSDEERSEASPKDRSASQSRQSFRSPISNDISIEKRASAPPASAPEVKSVLTQNTVFNAFLGGTPPPTAEHAVHVREAGHATGARVEEYLGSAQWVPDAGVREIRNLHRYLNRRPRVPVPQQNGDRSQSSLALQNSGLASSPALQAFRSRSSLH
jgi:hypothetical protein